MVATSTPADLRAVRADGGARKVKSLGAGVPRSVMVGSRGSPALLAAVVDGRAVVAVEEAAWAVVGAGAAPGSSSPPHALSNSSAARVSEATTWRRSGKTRRWWGGRGTAGSRVRRSGKRRLGSHAVTRPCQGCSAAQARVVHPGRAHGVASRRPRRAEDLPQHVVGPGGHAPRPQQPAKAPARLAPPLGRAYLAVPLGVGVQLGDALVAELPVHVVPAHDILLVSLTPVNSLHWCSPGCNR